MSEHPGKKVLAEIMVDYVGDDKFLKVASYILDLESRLEKAEAERDAAYDRAVQIAKKVSDLLHVARALKADQT